MGITEKKFVEELFYRGAVDGFVGAHAREGTAFVDESGKVLSVTIADPRPITAKEFKSLLGGEVAELFEAADDARKSAVEAARVLRTERHAHHLECTAHKERADVAQRELKKISDKIAKGRMVTARVSVGPAKAQ